MAKYAYEDSLISIELLNVHVQFFSGAAREKKLIWFKDN